MQKMREAETTEKIKNIRIQFLKNKIETIKNAQVEGKKFEDDKVRKINEFLLKYDCQKVSHYIPAMNIPYTIGSSKILIYFHANAEDIVLSNELMDFMRSLLRINVIAVEYPGYGLYTEEYQKRSTSGPANTMSYKQMFM